MRKGWVNRTSGELKRVFFAGEVTLGYSESTHGLVDVPDEFGTTKDWDVATRAFVSTVALEPVPVCVTPRQMDLALLSAGLLDDVEALLETMPREVQISWTRATQINRDDPMLAAAIPLIGMTDAEADDLFRLAATL